MILNKMNEIIFENKELNLENIKEYINKNNIKVIFFAETHGMVDELRIQEKIIEYSKPDFYLYELLEEDKLISEEDFKNFLSREDNEDFSIISQISDLKPTVKIAKKFNIPLIGCDIKNMLRKDTKFRELNKISNSKLKKEEGIIKKREEKQIEIINKYLNFKTNLLFVSLGAHHLRENSPVLKSVRSNYLIVYPLFNGRKIDEIDDHLSHKIKFYVKSNITKNEKKISN